MSVKDAMLDAAKRVHHKFVVGIRVEQRNRPYAPQLI